MSTFKGSNVLGGVLPPSTLVTSDIFGSYIYKRLSLDHIYNIYGSEKLGYR